MDKWQSYSIGPAPENFKTVVADIDQDGQPDVLYSSSEDIADIVWYKAQDGNPRGIRKAIKYCLSSRRRTPWPSARGTEMAIQTSL